MTKKKSKGRCHVYIAGPLSCGGDSQKLYLSVNDAIKAGAHLLAAGIIPFVPHLNVLWAFVAPTTSYEEWMEYDFAWVRRCDAVLRLPGESPGADREVALAKKLKLPVFTCRGDLYAWARWQGFDL